jgi:Methyltransferase domain
MGLALRQSGGSVGMASRSWSGLSYAVRVGGAALKNPFEAKERILDRIDEWRQEGNGDAGCTVDADWNARLHELLQVTWPCEEGEAYAQLWTEIRKLLLAKGLAVGRGAFGGWDDADPALARAAWCITRHARPGCVLETGVGRGVTTRVILEALERNGGGRLFSIDLPPLLDIDLHTEIAAAVPDDLRSRWRLVRGSSRRQLKALVGEIQDVEFFLHDSMHSTRNMQYELETVWPQLTPGGFVLMDDIDKNFAFHSFVERLRRDSHSLVGRGDDGGALIGVIQKTRA